MSETARFGPFELDFRTGELRKNGRKIRLQEQPVRVLALLLEHPGELVTREQIQSRLWPDDIVVDFEYGINSAMMRLRTALGDSASNPRYIETLSRRGYRFLMAVEKQSSTETPQPASEAPETDVPSAARATPRYSKPLRRWSLISGAAVLASLVAVLAFNVGGWRDRLLHPVAAPQIRSLAVMPFLNLSNGHEQDYLVEGTTDAVVTDLAKLNAFAVISLSAMTYKRAQQSVPQIATELHADAVVKGTVLRAGNRVRVTAQLIQGKTGRYLWADSYERDATDVLALQNEVAQAIAGQIFRAASPGNPARIVLRQQANPAAYDAYLRGRYFWNKRSTVNLEKAIGYFNQAIEKDPGYAPGYAGLADAYLLLGELAGHPPQEVFPRARAAAEQALKLDSGLAEAHASLGALDRNESKWAEAGREFRRALELNPSNATAHQWYAELLVQEHRLDEAITEITRARELDPFSLVVNTQEGRIFYLARQYDQAIAQLVATVDMDPNFYMSHADLGFAYMQKNMYREALQEFQKSLDLNPRPTAKAWVAEVYALSGEGGRARQMLPDLKNAAQAGTGSLWELGMIYFALGDQDEALRLMKGALEKGEFNGRLLKFDPLFDRMRAEHHFAGQLRQAGLDL